MSKKLPDWVKMDCRDLSACCERCGKREIPKLPMPVSSLVKWCEYFGDMHKSCSSNAAGQGREAYPAPAGSASLVAQPPRDVSELYHDLLYAVARKFPGESRHETALRYIRDTEERVGEAGSCKQNNALTDACKKA